MPTDSEQPSHFATPDQAWFISPPPKPATPKPPPPPKPATVPSPPGPARSHARRGATLPTKRDDAELVPRWFALAEAFGQCVDRLDAAVLDGRIDVMEDDAEPVDALQITRGEFDLLLEIIQAPPPNPPKEPAQTTPRSADRIEDYASRVSRGEAVFHPEDRRTGERDGIEVLTTGYGQGEQLGLVVLGEIEDCEAERPAGSAGKQGRPREPRVYRQLRDE